MPSRPLLFDLGCRNATICRSCLLSVRQQPVAPAQAWVAPFSSGTARRARNRSRLSSRGPSMPRVGNADLRQFADELKAMGVENPGLESEDDSRNVSVRFFDQHGQDRIELPDDDVSVSPDAAFTVGLGSMKDMLKTQDERNAFQEVIQEMGVDWKNIRSHEDVEKAKAQMRAYTASIDAQIERATADLPKDIADELRISMGNISLEDEHDHPQTAVPQIPETPWTTNQKKKIAKLNSVFRQIARQRRREGALTNKMVVAVYKAYHNARLTLAHGWNNVPIDVWDALWEVFSADESVNIKRLAHISLLSRDMSEAKVTMSPSQQLLTIEAVFVDGWETRAVDNWKRCVGTLGVESSETFQDFWELGVRMYCRTGNMEQAERAVARLLDNHTDPRILIPIIRTYSERGTAADQEKAWSAYRRMRDLLGETIRLEDYDQVVSFFLTANQTENALYAFVDMMSDGEIDLKKQRFLPSVVANKFFLGKWLKRLIGAGDLNGASAVVDFMREKGVGAAAIHLNGLIGAWQRSGGADDVAKADELGWKMIEARISFVKGRGSEAVVAVDHRKPTGPAPLPRANLETFSLLAENYRVRGLHQRLGALWDAFRDAEICPDAFMMNQLLESYIQSGQVKEALDLYNTLVADRGVVPDPYTFSALWKTLAINRLHVVPSNALSDETDLTRQLFAETVKFRAVFQPSMDGQLGRKILHSFRRLQDNAGFLMALTALKDMFKFMPPEPLVLEMVLGTTKIAWDTETQRRRLMTAKKDMDRELLAWAGNDAHKLEGDRRADALYEYLQKKFWPEGDDVGAILVGVAKQMGVYELLAPAKKKKKSKAV